MLSDLLGSVGVIISAILIMVFEWYVADPILSVVIALLIVFNTRKLIVRILNVLLEGSPEHIDVYKLSQRPTCRGADSSWRRVAVSEIRPHNLTNYVAVRHS